MKILWLTNIPSPYRVDFFNELGKYCELTVLFERESSSERDESWTGNNFFNFKGVFLKGKKIGVDKAISFNVTKFLSKNIYDQIIVSNFLTPTGIIAIEYMRLKKINYILESDGGFPTKKFKLVEIFKKHIIKNADAYFSTAHLHDEYYLKYGADKNKIIRYPFTSIYTKQILMQPLSNNEKRSLRTKLSINEQKVILTVGQFIYRKGLDILIKACRDIDSTVGVYIIGGIPPIEYIKLKEDLGLFNIHFVNFTNSDELKYYYQAADLFVLPTREDIWGLVINEAMANGLPIITTNKCIAGLELVKDKNNGIIIPINDNVALSQAINSIIFNSDILKEMANESIRIIKGYTLEKMTSIHLEEFKKRKYEINGE